MDNPASDGTVQSLAGAAAAVRTDLNESMEGPRVEDMPLEKKLEVLKKYNPYEKYDDGRFIDAQDSVNTWCLGQITEVEGKNIRIHFDGWSTKWDVVSILSTDLFTRT